MDSRLSEKAPETRLIASSASSALISTMVPCLPNSVLVQLVRCDFAGAHGTSLYVVYREGGMTFDAIVRFDACGAGLPLHDVLQRFLAGSMFERSVLDPLAAAVHRHFRR